MNIKKFVDEFKKIDKEDDKKAFVKKHITKTYIPYSNKMLIAQKLAEITTYADVDKHNRLRVNTNLRHAYMILYAVALYTDIEVNFVKKSDEDIDAIFYYDMLEKSHLDEYIQRAIGEDYYKLDTMVATAVDDIMDNQDDIGGIIREGIDMWRETTTNMFSNIDMSKLDEFMISEQYKELKDKVGKNGTSV